MNFQTTIRCTINGIFLAIIFITGLTSCYKEYFIYPDPSSNDFNFLMTTEQEESILASRRERLLIIDPDPVLFYNNQEYAIDRFQLRGVSTLEFRKKSFSVNLDKRLRYYIDEENRDRDIENFKLISMVFDYTYIEEGIAIELFRRLELWPLFSFYTEVKLNNNTQGLYLFIEDPEDYYLNEKNAACILRRGYRNEIDDYELNENIASQSVDYYKNHFYAIYDLILKYSGRQLYDSLVYHIDIEEYCKKIAVDMLLQNGDYTDEVFFYTKEKNEREVFGVVPWDYDDLFSKAPHEIWRSWAVGTKFGNRIYDSMDDIYADVGRKLLFSVEDDLDYKIATDSFLYKVYLDELQAVLNVINSSFISKTFDKVRSSLQPFYDQPEIIEQSKYDEVETSLELFEMNLMEKENHLIERIAWLNNKLEQTYHNYAGE